MSSQEQISACAQLVSIHSEIMAMPMAYDTLIGDIGTGLSGGQKQRTLLARALYKNPKLLMFDDATSHLDVWHEQAVNAAIRLIPLTRVIVASSGNDCDGRAGCNVVAGGCCKGCNAIISRIALARLYGLVEITSDT